jgi:glycosyltransferase involved in cell wall biosynthesis
MCDRLTKWRFKRSAEHFGRIHVKAIEDNPGRVTYADIVVGIPSFNEADSIAYPVTQSDRGLSDYFGDRSAVIINCDNHSLDNTRQVFMATATQAPKIYLSTPQGVKGKGNNFRNLFAKAVELQAKAVVVLDADLKSVTPRWIRSLGQPLFEDYHYVTPLYVRHKWDGTITNNIAYPVTRALYGRRIRQPIGGDFGFSGELARLYVEGEAWSDSVANFGIDIWMTTTATLSRLPVIQSFMGRPKIHKPKDPAADLGPMFADVVGTIFDLMRYHDEFWTEVKWSRPTAIYGFGLGEVEMPPPVEVNLKALAEKFLSGLRSQWDLYEEFLPEEILAKLEEVAEFDLERFEFPTTLWAKVFAEFACAYKKTIIPREQLVISLTPLYNGRVLSFVLETESLDTQQVEEVIEAQCVQFEKTKPYLLERWFSE